MKLDEILERISKLEEKDKSKSTSPIWTEIIGRKAKSAMRDLSQIRSVGRESQQKEVEESREREEKTGGK